MHIVVVLDCGKPDHLADFWAAALGYDRSPYRRPYVELTDPDGRRPTLLLQAVPEPKSGKNRMHLDLRVNDLDAEVTRLIGLGARQVVRPFSDQGFLTTWLADPEGNEFCVIVPPSG